LRTYYIRSRMSIQTDSRIIFVINHIWD